MRTSLVKNSLYNILYKLLNVVFPLVSITYVSHIIGAEGVGKVSSAQNIVQYFVLAASLGIPNYGIRAIARNADKTIEKNIVFTELFLINFVMTCASTFIYGLYISTLDIDSLALYLAAGILIPLNIFNIDWLYQGEEQYKYITCRSMIVKIVSLGLLFFTVRNREQYINYAIISSVATGSNYIFNMVHLKSMNIKLCFSKVRWISIRQHLKPIFIFFGTTVAVELYTLLDTTMLTVLCASENVGYYSNASKIVKTVIVTVTSAVSVLLPRLNMYYKEGKKDECIHIIWNAFDYLWFVFLPCGIGMILIAEDIVFVLFGQSFEDAIVTLQIESLLVYALGFSNLFGTQVLLTFDSEKKLLKCTIIGAVVNIIMNSVLIPAYQQNGAALASVFSETVVTIITFVYAKKYIGVHFNRRTISVSIIATIIMSLAVIAVQQLEMTYLEELIASVLIGVCTYLFANIFLKNPIIKSISGLIRKIVN